MNRLLSLVAALLALSVTARSADQVLFSEIMYNPPGLAPEWIEVRNISITPFDMAKWRLTDGVSLELPDFTAGDPQAHLLKPLERILLSSTTPAATRAAWPSIPPTVRIFGPWTGALDNDGERVTLRDRHGMLICSVRYGDGDEWPAAADGVGHSIILINENKAADDFRNWRASGFTGGTPGNPEITSSEEPFPSPVIDLSLGLPVVNYADQWSFYKELTPAPPANWNTLAFTPSAPWGSGPGLLGFETAPLPAPGLQTPVQTASLLTYYFRRTFTWNGATSGVTYSVDQVNDDGAIYFLNGQELGRSGTGGTGAVAHNVVPPNTRTVGEAVEETNVLSGAVPAGLLVAGENVFAAVAIQVGTGSTDMVFGAKLKLGNPTTPTVVINEVKPGPAGQGFVEFYNTTGAPISLNGYYLSDTAANLAKYQITSSLTVPASGFATIGFAESNLTLGATTTVFLTQPDGITPISGIQGAIPIDGRSLGRKPNGGATWFLFLSPTPGQANSSSADLATSVTLNEAHFTAQNHIDFIELKNLGNAAIPATGLFLATATDFSDKLALSGLIPPNGYASWNTNFDAGNDGEVTVYLIDGQDNVLGAAEWQHPPGRDSQQAWPEGTGEWYATVVSTRNAANVPDRVTSVVINEVMYDPPSNHRNGEYIELFNRSALPVSLAGWQLTGEVDFIFPAGATIPPGGYLVVGNDAGWLNSVYGIGAVGNWDGQLSNKGGLVRLEDAVGNLADSVDYKISGDWPELAAGLGSSMELVHPDMDNSRPSAWRDSDESNKTTMQSYSWSGVFQQFRYNGTDADSKELEMWLVGDAHVILQNIQVRKDGTGANLLQNPTRLTPNNLAGNPASNGGWLIRGTHHQSFFDESGNLHLISEGHGENKRNCADCDIVPLLTGDNITISFDARWVYGKNRLIAQTFDQSVGKDFLLPIPNNLGTPGAANSRFLASPLPQVDAMTHSPAVPRPAQPVTVTARVASALPLSAVELVHRPDDANTNPVAALNWVAKAMVDNGTAGDVTAGDGVFTATLTEYPTNGQIVQFYVRATSAAGTTAYPKQGAAQSGLYIVDNQTIPGDVRIQRLVISQYWRDALQSNINGTVGGPSAKFNHKFPKIQNHYFPCVFIHNETDIYYGAGMRKGGSPWTRTDDNGYTGGLSRGAFVLPEDRTFRGDRKKGYDNDSPGSGMHNRVVRYWLNQYGVPVNQNEFVRLVINNSGPNFREDYEPDNNQLLDRAIENGSDGELYSVEDGWWLRDFDDVNRTYQDADWVYGQLSKNSDAPTRWHNEYSLRTREAEYDFSALTGYLKMVSDNNFSQSELESIFDVDSVTAYQAVRGYIYDWDSFLINRGKNCFFYRRADTGKFIFLHWDSDLAFQDANNSFLGSGRNIRNVMDKGYVRRKFIHFLNDMLAKYTNDGTGISPRFNAWLDAEEASSNSFSINKPFYVTWCQNRRNPTITEINQAFGGGQNAFTAPFALIAPLANTTDNTIGVTGTAPAIAYSVAIDGHPEAVFAWVNGTTFSFSGIVLRSGVNTLTLRMYDINGAIVGSPLVHNITKTGDAPPVPLLTADPPSLNVALGEILTLDAGASYDPDLAGPLVFNWSINPAAGVAVGQPSAGSRTYGFSVPGLYTVTLSVTDAGNQTTVVTRIVTVFNSAEFLSFGELTLDPSMTASNVEKRDNYSPSGWYSLEDKPGRLLIQVLDDAPHTLDSGNHPYLSRDLPDAADWVLQTDLDFDTREVGRFNAGLYVEMVENGVPVRYAFGPENKSALQMLRSVNGGAFSGGGGAGLPSIRINCGGPGVTESNGAQWQADDFFLNGTTFTQTFTGAVNGTINDSGREAPTLTYDIPLPNGSYNITLHSSGASSVLQEVFINGVTNGIWNVGSGLTFEKIRTLTNYAVTGGNLNISLTRTGGTYTSARLTGIEVTPPPVPPPPSVAFSALQVRRSGNQLIFSRLTDGVWVDVTSQALPAGSTAHRGGVFAATSIAESIRVNFDYLLLVNPGNTNTILGSLKITELMYNPVPGGVEFIELRNTGTQTINLQGVNFEDGSPFTAFTFGNENLAPGEFIVITENIAAFQAAYGAGIRLGGQWVDGSLSNSGERIHLRNAQGNPIHEPFEFDDEAPWPLTADGDGPSIEVIDLGGDYGNGLNWRASFEIGGSPGSDGAGQDADHDGVPDAIEALFGTNPNDGNSQAVAAATTNAAGQVNLSWPSVPGRSYRIDRCYDLVNWAPLQTVVATASTTAFMDTTAAANPRTYYRIVALP